MMREDSLAPVAMVVLAFLFSGGCSVDESTDTAPVVTREDWKKIESLGGHAELSYNFASSSLTDSDLAEVPRLDRVVQLDLSDTEITDAGVMQLKDAVHLEVLNLRGTAVTNAALETLRQLPRLCEVNLHATAVSGDGQMEMYKFFKPRAEARRARLRGETNDRSRSF